MSKCRPGLLRLRQAAVLYSSILRYCTIILFINVCSLAAVRNTRTIPSEQLVFGGQQTDEAEITEEVCWEEQWML